MKKSIAYAVLTAISSGSAHSGEDLAPSAREACKQFMTSRLHDPSSTEWGESWNWTTIKNSDGTYSVGMKFRSTNALGARVAVYYTCITKPRGRDQWELEKISRMM